MNSHKASQSSQAGSKGKVGISPDSMWSVDSEALHSDNGSVASGRSFTSKPEDADKDEKANGYCSTISRAKLVALTLCFLVSAATGLAAYFFSSTSEREAFENGFSNAAQTVVNNAHENSKGYLHQFEAFSTSITSMTSSSNTSLPTQSDALWPLVTLPNWAAQSNELKEYTGADRIAFIPLVPEAHLEKWNNYSVRKQGWIQQSVDYYGYAWEANEITDCIWRVSEFDFFTPVCDDRPVAASNPTFAPIWQTTVITPDNDRNQINRNAYDIGFLAASINEAINRQESIQSEFLSSDELTAQRRQEVNSREDGPLPVTAVVSPIFEDSPSVVGATIGEFSKVVGVIYGILEFENDFTNSLPEGVNGVVVVVKNPCGETFTLKINGPTVVNMGSGDLHDPGYDEYVVIADLDAIPQQRNCLTTLFVYPSESFEDEYVTSRPIIYTVVIVFIFIGAAVLFVIYDWTVEQRKEDLVAQAAKTSALVNSLFPANVRDRLIQGDINQGVATHVAGGGGIGIIGPDGRRLSNEKEEAKPDDLAVMVLDGMGNKGVAGPVPETDAAGVFTTKPIADLFPAVTVMFADIVGFTAWSSSREPSQVFTLLETMYNSFDKLAKRRKVFKVETIGDCYVAACGLPDPRDDHAVCMARFAHDCLIRMKEVVTQLEVSLGPDTAELGMRFGLHSGPVTAGVLRGEKSRFQLFGDTVNTAARVESTGAMDKVHMSMETAELLKKHGKGHWVERRNSLVKAKGKGEIQTFWLALASQERRNRRKGPRNRAEEVMSHQHDEDDMDLPIEEISKTIMDTKMQRLIGWNIDVLKRQLRQILAMREASKISSAIACVIDSDDTEAGSSDHPTAETDSSSRSSVDSIEGLQIFGPLELKKKGFTVLDEVVEIIQLPGEPAAYKLDPYQIELSDEVIHQLSNYVTAIAEMYRDNPFHSFEHASHVTMSVCKLLSRVVTPESIDFKKMEVRKEDAEELHNYTYGITSDPICQFACALSALIHDVDHTGVPNITLVKENTEIAQLYKNKSCAEQNSLDLAWGLLMEPQYAELRSCIYSTQEELDRFRQLLVNSVMATDIADRELGQLRKDRWYKAFNNEAEEAPLQHSNRKATIVIEHLIQASDVSHTMQHWHVYIKWNEKLFQEMYRAYLAGRADKDPSENWYESEIGFFDFYLIPLAKKLKDCGVFGVASDEYLTYVTNNRTEWERKGKDCVMEYLENYKRENGLEERKDN